LGEYIAKQLNDDILSIQDMLPFLSLKDNGDKIFLYDSLESTNKTAKEMAIAGAKHGTLVIADHQTEGRGRYGRKFFSPPKRGIYMSFILHLTNLWLIAPTLVTLFAAVSVCEAIETITEKSPQIKWVNDIFLNEKKICGILTETVMDFESRGVQWIIVGIGINFTMPQLGFPEELKHIAGSIFTESHPAVTRNHLIAEIINRMMTFEGQHNREEIISQYKKRLIMLGKRVLITDRHETFEATAIDIDDMGCLVVKEDSGEFRSLSTGEVNEQIKIIYS